MYSLAFVVFFGMVFNYFLYTLWKVKTGGNSKPYFAGKKLPISNTEETRKYKEKSKQFI